MLLVSHEKIIENKHLGRRCYSTPFIGCAPLRDTPLLPPSPFPSSSSSSQPLRGSLHVGKENRWSRSREEGLTRVSLHSSSKYVARRNGEGRGLELAG